MVQAWAHLDNLPTRLFPCLLSLRLLGIIITMIPRTKQDGMFSPILGCLD